MIKCVDCKFYSSEPYLRCAVNPLEAFSGGCEMGETRDGYFKAYKQNKLEVFEVDYDRFRCLREQANSDVNFKSNYSPEEVTRIYNDVALRNLGSLP
jgi:hypothetical protein